MPITFAFYPIEVTNILLFLYRVYRSSEEKKKKKQEKERIHELIAKKKWKVDLRTITNSA